MYSSPDRAWGEARLGRVSAGFANGQLRIPFGDHRNAQTTVHDRGPVGAGDTALGRGRAAVAGHSAGRVEPVQRTEPTALRTAPVRLDQGFGFRTGLRVGHAGAARTAPPQPP